MLSFVYRNLAGVSVIFCHIDDANRQLHQHHIAMLYVYAFCADAERTRCDQARKWNSVGVRDGRRAAVQGTADRRGVDDETSTGTARLRTTG